MHTHTNSPLCRQMWQRMGGPRRQHRMRTHTHDTHAHTHARTRIHTYTHARTHTRTHTHTHARTHAGMHARTYARTHARRHARTHIRTHARTHAHTNTHTHTHTHTLKNTHTHMSKRAKSTHKLPVHSAKGFANFSASLAMLPPTCPSGVQTPPLPLRSPDRPQLQ